jgi:hypothetical protein
MAAKWAEQEGTQFTCFTRQLTCCTSTKVQILAQKALRKTRITCFTSTKVQILTQKALRKTRIYKEPNHRDDE